MAFNVEPGEECIIDRPVVIEGSPAFDKGDLVKIVEINADPQSPGYKYVVECERLGRTIRLRGVDLRRNWCPQCHSLLQPPGTKCDSCQWESLDRERPPAKPGKSLLTDHIDPTYF